MILFLANSPGGKTCEARIVLWKKAGRAMKDVETTKQPQWEDERCAFQRVLGI